MNESVAGTRECMRCRQAKPITNFLPTGSPFFPKGHSLICTSCLERMVPANNLDKVDALMRYLDLPFDIDRWTSLYATYKDHTLTAYSKFLGTGRYATIS